MASMSGPPIHLIMTLIAANVTICHELNFNNIHYLTFIIRLNVFKYSLKMSIHFSGNYLPLKIKYLGIDCFLFNFKHWLFLTKVLEAIFCCQ